MSQPDTAPPSGPITYDPNEFWLRTLFRWYIGLIIHPTPTIREIVEREQFLVGLLTTCAAAVLWIGLLVSYRLLYLPISDFVQGVFVLGPISAGILVILTIAIAVAIHVMAQLLRSAGTLDGTLATLLMANVVGLFTAMVGLLLFLVDSFVVSGQNLLSLNSAYEWLILGTLAWLILMLIIVIRENYHASWSRITIIAIGGLAVGVPVGTLLNVPLIAVFVFVDILLST